MRMREFIRENKNEIDSAINKALGKEGYFPKRNDAEREIWILNDEGLYRWAQSAGVQSLHEYGRTGR